MTPDRENDTPAPTPESETTLIDRICDDFEDGLRQGRNPRIDDLLGSVKEPLRSRLFKELLLSDLEFRFGDESTVDTGMYLARFPDRAEQIRAIIVEFWKGISGRSRAQAAGGSEAAPGCGPSFVDQLVGQEYGGYQVLHEVARGGMGIVFKAYDLKLQRTVALKMILDRNLASQEAVQRFYAEAETAAGLNHPGIVPVYDVGSHAGQHYYAMGFVEGPTLADELRRRRFSMEESARLVLEVANAVVYAHAHGVVHRDLKPGNILLLPDGQPQITDFGLAKRTDHPSQLTMDGQILGTPGYMAPEQAAGDVEQAGPAADIYAMGAILYNLITGHPPFRTALDALVCVLEQDPVPPRALNRRVPRDLNVICMKCLSKNPADRYESALQLASDLQSYLDGELIQARPASLRRRLQRWARHRPRLASVLVTMAAFYTHHLVSLGLGNPGSLGEFHNRTTITMLFVCGYAWVYQMLLMRPGAQKTVLYAWLGTDILVFTLYLLFVVKQPNSPLVVIYFCMVASAALAFDRYLVWSVTAACVLSYVFQVVFHCYQAQVPLIAYRETMPIVIGMLAIGVVQYYVLRCARIQLNQS